MKLFHSNRVIASHISVSNIIKDDYMKNKHIFGKLLSWIIDLNGLVLKSFMRPVLDFIKCVWNLDILKIRKICCKILRKKKVHKHH